MKFSKIPIFILAAAMSPSTLVIADEEIPFEEFILFNELNNTDGDLGIHFLLDGGPWKRIEIEGPDGPNERTLIKVRARGPLGRQGGTEIFFESAEPTFDDLTPAEFFARFPEGIYEAEGIGLEGEEFESEDYYSHTMPAPADEVKVTGFTGFVEPDLEGECDEPLLSVEPPVVISWDQVTTSHSTICNSDPCVVEDVEIEIYELVVEDDEGDAVLNIIIPAEGLPDGPVSVTIPDDYIAITNEWKFEILATAADTGNATAVESCFGIL